MLKVCRGPDHNRSTYSNSVATARKCSRSHCCLSSILQMTNLFIKAMVNLSLLQQVSLEESAVAMDSMTHTHVTASGKKKRTVRSLFTARVAHSRFFCLYLIKLFDLLTWTQCFLLECKKGCTACPHMHHVTA